MARQSRLEFEGYAYGELRFVLLYYSQVYLLIWIFRSVLSTMMSNEDKNAKHRQTGTFTGVERFILKRSLYEP